MPRNLFPSAIVLLLAGAGLQAQTSQPPPLPGEILPQSLERETPAPKTRFLVAGLRLTSDLDDNVLNTSNNKQYALTGMIEPHLGWTLIGPRYSWLLDYHFGFSTSYPVSIYDSQSHLLDSAFQINLTKRLKLRLRNRLDESKDLFSRFLEPESAAGFGVLDRPNDSILTSAVRRSSEQAGLDVSYALGPHSLAAVSGSFFQVNYGTPQALQPGQVLEVLENSTSLAGHAIYLHHLAPAYWAGLEYSVQKFTAQSFQSPVLVNSFFFTQTISFTPKTSIALFGGPEYFTTQDGVNMQPGLETARLSAWHLAGGATYTWTHSHAAYTAAGYHKISDGGGLLGIVRVSGATTQFRYQLSSQWTGSVMAAYERNRPILAQLSPVSYGSALAGLGRRLTGNLSMEFSYGRTYLPLSTKLAKLADHNRASVSLVYEFKNPIGR